MPFFSVIGYILPFVWAVLTKKECCIEDKEALNATTPPYLHQQLRSNKFP